MSKPSWESVRDPERLGVIWERRSREAGGKKFGICRDPTNVIRLGVSTLRLQQSQQLFIFVRAPLGCNHILNLLHPNSKSKVFIFGEIIKIGTT